MTSPRDYRIAAVDRALSVLAHLGECPDRRVTEIAAALGMNKSLVFRILQTLEARGFVARDPSGTSYSLGLQMSVLGARAGLEKGLVAIAAPVMEALREETAENVNLVVREGTRGFVLASREGRHSMRLFAQTGRHGPLHAGGASVLLLAFAPNDIREEVLAGDLPAYTPATETDPDALRARLARIRSEGHHISRNDFVEGAFSIAAPIRAAGGRVNAAISVAGALARLDSERTALHLAAVKRAGATISAKIGFDDAAPESDAA
jgi:IclR family KDG regulon transcriptional repressor